VFWVISAYFNIRNTLPKSGTFLLGQPVYTGHKTKQRTIKIPNLGHPRSFFPFVPFESLRWDYTDRGTSDTRGGRCFDVRKPGMLKGTRRLLCDGFAICQHSGRSSRRTKTGHPLAERTTTQHCCKANDTTNRTSIHHDIKTYSVAKTSNA